MNKSEYEEYLQSVWWRQRRLKALTRAGDKCQLCSSEDRLEVHHNNYDRVGREIETDLVVLCNRCHRSFHWRKKQDAIARQDAPMCRGDREAACKQKQKNRKNRTGNPKKPEHASACVSPSPGNRKDVILSRYLIKSLATKRGGFTCATITALGITWPPTQGWQFRLIGDRISADAYDAAVAGSLR